MIIIVLATVLACKSDDKTEKPQIKPIRQIAKTLILDFNYSDFNVVEDQEVIL
jgi:hypothetical protein